MIFSPKLYQVARSGNRKNRLFGTPELPSGMLTVRRSARLRQGGKIYFWKNWKNMKIMLDTEFSLCYDLGIRLSRGWSCWLGVRLYAFTSIIVKGFSFALSSEVNAAGRMQRNHEPQAGTIFVRRAVL
jgi:hypothetical protein